MAAMVQILVFWHAVLNAFRASAWLALETAAEWPRERLWRLLMGTAGVPCDRDLSDRVEPPADHFRDNPCNPRLPLASDDPRMVDVDKLPRHLVDPLPLDRLLSDALLCLHLVWA